jgi:hypothetical protein
MKSLCGNKKIFVGHGFTGCGKSNLACHSERSEESLLGLSLTKEREILRFAQNDNGVGRFFPAAS